MTGPHSDAARSSPHDPQADRWIRSFFGRQSRTFSFATRLLPVEIRQPVAVIYLFCRTVDDMADSRPLTVGRDAARVELDELERRLEDTLAGRPPDDLLWPRLARVVHAWSLPHAPFRELVSGARWDLDGRPIVDMDDLVAYSELVAGSVGAMVLPLLVTDPVRRADLLTPARAFGVAMQITNILRDVGEDRRRLGRVYLPAALVEEVGLDPGGVPDPADPAYGRLLERLMEEAERRYAIGLESADHLPRRVRRGIRSAGAAYREILNEIRANGYDNIERRAVVPLVRKIERTLSDGYERRKLRLVAAASP